MASVITRVPGIIPKSRSIYFVRMMSDTAAGGTKPATLETGLSIQVPLFVNPGDVVKVDTRTSEYLNRV